MATTEELYTQFDLIQDNVFTNIVPRTPPCNGPACDTRVEPPPKYQCVPCGTGPNQGYLSPIAGSDAVSSIINIINSLESIDTGNTAKGKLTKEAINLHILDLQLSEKIKELYDFQEIIGSLRKIINNEIGSLG